MGTRQCGKTTLLRRIHKDLPNAEFISFEDREILDIFINDLKSFVRLYAEGNDYLFIDEFQYAKNGGKGLKYIYDNYNTKILISGSSAIDLSVQSIKYLAGRIFVFTLYPLSFREFLRYRDERMYKIFMSEKDSFSPPVTEKMNSLYEEFALFGGYPRVALSETDEERIDALKNIFNTYLLREIREILQIGDDLKIEKMVALLAVQTGGVTNYNEISGSLGMTYNEIIKNFGILEKTFIINSCRPYFTNKKKEIVKAPKYYFLDNGFRNVVLKDFRRPSFRTDRGPLNENFISSEILKTGEDLRFWRTKAKAEVDFIIEKNRSLYPIEVKSLLTDKKITPSLRSFIDEYKPRKGFVLSYDMTGKKAIKDCEIRFMPIFSINRMLKSI